MAIRYYRAMESVSIASALYTALTIYPCQIRVHQRWQSKLQHPTARKKEWRPATADSSHHAITCQHCDTHYFSRPRTRNLPIVDWLLVRRATSSATDSPTTWVQFSKSNPIHITARNHKYNNSKWHLFMQSTHQCIIAPILHIIYNTKNFPSKTDQSFY